MLRMTTKKEQKGAFFCLSLYYVVITAYWLSTPEQPLKLHCNNFQGFYKEKIAIWEKDKLPQLFYVYLYFSL